MISKVNEDTYIYQSIEYGPVAIKSFDSPTSFKRYRGPKKPIPSELSEEMIYSLPDELKPDEYFISDWFDYTRGGSCAWVFASTLIDKEDRAANTFLFMDIKDLTNGCTD